MFETVVSYARKAGLGKITLHDFQRTFAKLAHQGRAAQSFISGNGSRCRSL